METTISSTRKEIKEYYNTVLNITSINGDQARAICPFHRDNNPSLSINLTNGLFYCFGCGRKGNIITFRRLMKGYY